MFPIRIAKVKKMTNRSMALTLAQAADRPTGCGRAYGASLLRL